MNKKSYNFPLTEIVEIQLRGMIMESPVTDPKAELNPGGYAPKKRKPF